MPTAARARRPGDPGGHKPPALPAQQRLQLFLPGGDGVQPFEHGLVDRIVTLPVRFHPAQQPVHPVGRRPHALGVVEHQRRHVFALAGAQLFQGTAEFGRQHIADQPDGRRSRHR